MPIIDVDLTPELEDYIQAMIRSGEYKSGDEVIAAGLRLMQKQDEPTATDEEQN